MEQEHGRMEVGEDLRNEIRRGVRITLASFRYDAQKKTKQQARSHVIFFPYLSSKLSHRFSSTPTSHLCSELSVFQPQSPVARGKEWTLLRLVKKFHESFASYLRSSLNLPFAITAGWVYGVGVSLKTRNERRVRDPIDTRYRVNS